VTVVDASKGETGHHYPQFLPDGRHYFYTVASASPAVAGIYLGSFGSSERTHLISTDSNAFYASPGYLLFLRQGQLSAQAFDATRSQLQSDVIQLGEQVAYNPFSGRGAFAVSDTGVLIYRAPVERQLTWFDRSGRTLGTIGTPGLSSGPRLVPDGSRVFFNQLDPVTRGMDIWSWDLNRGTSAPVIRDRGKSWGAILSPDGSRIAYTSNRNGPSDLYERSISGEGADTVLRESPNDKTSLAWSPDGRFLIFSELDHSRVSKLWALPMVGTRTAIPIVRSAAGEWQGQVSPDGHWLAYVSNEGGTEQVYVRPFPAGEGKWSVSTRGGTEPHWRRDGKEVFYIATDGHLMMVPVRTEPTFAAGTPSSLFMTRMGNSIRYGVLGQQYDVTADGQRFLINQERAEGGSQVSVVLNWPAELSATKSGDR
jgi:Tol biopolymer transport system component